MAQFESNRYRLVKMWTKLPNLSILGKSLYKSIKKSKIRKKELQVLSGEEIHKKSFKDPKQNRLF